MPEITIICPHCTASFQADDGGELVQCTWCSSAIPLKDVLPAAPAAAPAIAPEEIENTDLLFEHIREAVPAGRYQEAETLCDRVLDLDPKSASAWYLRGSSIAYQTDRMSLRMEEALFCWTKALELGNDTERATVVKEGERIAQRMLLRYLTAWGEAFAADPSPETARSFGDALPLAMDLYDQVAAALAVETPVDFFRGRAIAQQLRYVDRVWGEVQAAWSQAGAHPDETQYRVYLQGAAVCMLPMLALIEMDLARELYHPQTGTAFQSALAFLQVRIDACSWAQQDGAWHPALTIAPTAKERQEHAITALREHQAAWRKGYEQKLERAR